MARLSAGPIATVAVVVVAALTVCRWPRPRGRRLGPSAATGDLVETSTPPRCEPAWLHDALATLPLALDAGVTWTALRVAAPAATLVAGVLAGLSGATLALAALAAAPAGARRLVAARQRSQREAQLPVALERVATGVRAGSTLRQALADTAHATPAPLGLDLQVVAAELAHGAALPEALTRWGDHPGATSSTRLVASALGLAASCGGEVARSVDRVASTLRERREVQAEVRALATQARASAMVLGIAPIGFTALVAGVEPAVVSFLFTSTAGFTCLTAGIALDALGAMWMARILRGVS
ncbi:MAG: type II secretion system F family protein [Microthrixaceae bacterium]